MNISELIKIITLGGAMTLTACGGGGGGDDDTGGGNTIVDSDGDGVADSQDAFPNDANESKDSDGDGVGDNSDAFPNDASEHMDSDGDGIGDNADTDSDNSGTANVLSFNLSGAISVVTTENSATNTSDDGDGGTRGGAANPSVFSKEGRKLNQFVFHDSKNKQALYSAAKKAKGGSLTLAEKKKLEKSSRIESLKRVGLSAKSASQFAQDSTSNFFIIDENGDLQFAAESDFNMKVSYSVVWDHVELVEEPDPIVEGAVITTEVVTPYLFFAIDTQDFWQSHEFVAQTGGCAIFKVNAETADWSCVEQGMAAARIDESYRKTMSDQKRKPLQIDADGNVFFLAKQFTLVDDNEDGTVDWIQEDENFWNKQTLRKVASGDESGRDLVPDNFFVESFMAMPNDAVTYTAYDRLGNGERTLRLVKKASTDSPETIELKDSLPWGDFFYAKDDDNTIIYSDSQNWGQGVQFTQPITTGFGRYNIELDTEIFADNNWKVSPKRIIIADDGSMYGLFVEERHSEDSTTFIGKLKRMLPYSPATYATFTIGTDWDDYWQFFDNGQRDVQVAKGFVYYIEDENHVFNGTRSVIRAVRLVDGEQVNLLDDADWNERYEIYNWKLTNDSIYFTGFDKNSSTSISGRIDTLGLKQGAAEDDYLTISETSSVLGSSGKIDDLEVLRGEAPDSFTGGTPQVVRYFTDSENLYSASVEFSKYMDTESVEAGTTVSYLMDEDGVETKIDLEADNNEDGIQDSIVMKMWLNRTMHIVFDTDLTTINPNTGNVNTTTQPLATAQTYILEIDGESLDRDGFALVSGESDLDWTWSTRPSEGWYTGTAGAVEGITDGKVGRYASGENGNDYAEATLAKLGYPLNVKVEYSMPSSSEFRAELYLRDSHQVDWSQVESHPTDENGAQWGWQDGFEVLRDGSMAMKQQWVDNVAWRAAWNHDKGFKIGQPVVAEDTDGDGTNDLFYLDANAENEVRYVHVPYHHVDKDGNIYSDRWVDNADGNNVLYRKNLGTDPLNPDVNGEIYHEVPDYYQDQETSVKYYWTEVEGVWEWHDESGNIIDWERAYDYFPWAWEDSAGTRKEIQFNWRNESWLSIVDGSKPSVDLNDTTWQDGYYASDLDGDGKFNLAGLCRFGGPTDEFGGCTNKSFATAEAGEEYNFNQVAEWTWDPVFDHSDFEASTDDYRWFFYGQHGGWGDNNASDHLEMLILDDNPDWFSHGWDNRYEQQAGWSLQDWSRYEYHFVTDQSGETDVTTVTLKVYDVSGDVIFEHSRDLYLDVRDASWKVFSGVEGRENDGFKLDLRLINGDAVIDNIKVTDMSGAEATVILDENFDDGANVFTEQGAQ